MGGKKGRSLRKPCSAASVDQAWDAFPPVRSCPRVQFARTLWEAASEARSQSLGLQSSLLQLVCGGTGVQIKFGAQKRAEAKGL